MTWGAWWAWTPTGWQLCFGLGQITLALLAQLPTEPVSALDLSDKQLAEFVSHKWDDVEFPRERP